MLTSKKNIFLAFLAVLAIAFCLNELNINSIRNQTDKSNEFLNKELVFNHTILSIDNSWYLPQIHNYIAGKGFTCDTSSAKMGVRRTPVYPLFYGIHYLLFGEKDSFYFIKITQTVLFALSAIALLFAVFYLTNNKKIAWISYLMYGFNPTLISYTYFTITESLSPALICFMLFFFAKSVKYNTFKYWFFTGILFSLASLCRPTIFIFGGSVAFALIFINIKMLNKMIINGLAFGLAVSLFFIPYIIRNYKITNGDLVILEKFYNDPMGYGMQNIEFRRWISSWMNPSDYNSERVSNKMITHVQNGGDKSVLLDSLIATIPQRVYLSYDKKTVEEIYLSLYNYYEYKYSNVLSKNIDSAETNSIQFIRQKTQLFIRENPIRYYMLTPLLFLKSIIVQSNSATITYLDNYHTNKVSYLIKLLLILLNVYLFVSLFGNLLYLKKYFLSYIIIAIFTGINIGYLLFVIKYFEARYLVPLFPFLYVSGAIFAVETWSRFKHKLHF